MHLFQCPRAIINTAPNTNIQETYIHPTWNAMIVTNLSNVSIFSCWIKLMVKNTHRMCVSQFMQVICHRVIPLCVLSSISSDFDLYFRVQDYCRKKIYEWSRSVVRVRLSIHRSNISHKYFVCRLSENDSEEKKMCKVRAAASNREISSDTANQGYCFAACDNKIEQQFAAIFLRIIHQIIY